jgi:hypothetical protein
MFAEISHYLNLGYGYIIGNLLMILSSMLTIYEAKTKLKTLSRITFVIAGMLVMFSPIVVGSIVTRIQLALIIFLFINLYFGSKTLMPTRALLRVFIIVTAIYCIRGYNSRTLLPKEINSKKFENIYLLGNYYSTSSNSWGKLLKETNNYPITDLTDKGSDLNSLVKSSEFIPKGEALSIVLIDYSKVKNTPQREAEKKLMQLASYLNSLGHTILLFEFPTGIFDKGYLESEKKMELAAKVITIPRVYMFNVENSNFSNKNKDEIVANILKEILK